ncbi:MULTISPECIES: outer membrane protein assembly factor BamB family protein [unclassified Blastococcus]
MSSGPTAEAETSTWENGLPLVTNLDPVLAGDVVVAMVAESDTELEVAGVDPTTGETAWRVPAPMPAGGVWSTGPNEPVVISAVDAGGDAAVLVTYVVDVETSGLSEGGSQRYVAAVGAADGETRWEREAPGLLLPVGADDEVAVFSSDAARAAAVTALDPATGDQLWAADGLGSAALTGNSVVAVRRDGAYGPSALVGLDAATGAERWSTPPAPADATPSETHEWSILAAGGGSVLAHRDVSTVRGHAFTAWMLDAATGDQVATGPVETEGSANQVSAAVSPDGRSGYLIYPSVSLVAFNAAGGWRIELPELPQPSYGEPNRQRFVTVEDEVLRISSEGVVTIDAATGEQIGDVVPDDSGEVEPLFTVDGWEVRRISGLTGTRVEG